MEQKLNFKCVKVSKPFEFSSWFFKIFDSNFKPTFQVTTFDKEGLVVFVSKLYKRYSSSFKLLSRLFFSDVSVTRAEIRYIYKNRTYKVEYFSRYED